MRDGQPRGRCAPIPYYLCQVLQGKQGSPPSSGLRLAQITLSVRATQGAPAKAAAHSTLYTMLPDGTLSSDKLLPGFERNRLLTPIKTKAQHRISDCVARSFIGLPALERAKQWQTSYWLPVPRAASAG